MMRSGVNLKRIQTVLNVMRVSGLAPNPLVGRQNCYKIADGRIVQIRTAKLTSITKTYKAREYKYQVWHVNFDRIGDGVSVLFVGLFNSSGTQLLGIKGVPVDNVTVQHTALRRNRLRSTAGELLYARDAL